MFAPCFFLRLLDAALCFSLDRGHARVSLIRVLLAQPRASFVLRARREVVIERLKRGRTRCPLARWIR